jgi:hypothetical protein
LLSAEPVPPSGGPMQYMVLAERLEKVGRPIPVLGLRRIESEERRVDADADDLVVLAIVLGVSPVTLLMPYTIDEDGPVSLTGAFVGPVTSERAWLWLQADVGLAFVESSVESYWANNRFRHNARPPWDKSSGNTALGLLTPDAETAVMDDVDARRRARRGESDGNV